MRVTEIEVVEDRTERSTCLGGFLKLRRYTLRNVLEDGTRSPEYACDVMSRTSVDAVAIVLYQVAAAEGGRRRVRVLLKEGLRPAVYLRREKPLDHREERPFMTVTEIAAGMLEPGDAGPGGIERRAAHEAEEECGVALDPRSVLLLGGAMFPSPGVTDERVHFRAVPVAVDGAGPAAGDGSVMEQGTRPVVMDLDEALAACRRGGIPDMKTEIALLRLCDAIGYLPQLGCFRDELPPALAAAWRPLGMDAPQR